MSIGKKWLTSYAVIMFFVCLFLNAAIIGRAEEDQFRLPKYEKFVMSTGLTVYLMEQHETPLIYFSAVIPAGAVKDGDRYGLASLTADALLWGTKNYTKNQVQRQLDVLGAAYNTQANRDWTKVSASFGKKDLDTVMPILTEIITLPAFVENEFEKRKSNLLVELAQVKESPITAAINYYFRFLFDRSGLGNPIKGTTSSVSRMTPEDVKTFYKSYYKPAVSAIAVVGDFQTAAMKKKIQQWFQAWNAGGDIPQTTAIPLPDHEKTRLLLVNKPDAGEISFLMGGLGIKRSNPDYIPYLLVNNVLGGSGFTSWITDEIRVDEGLAYWAYSTVPSYKDGGIFAVLCMTSKPIEALDKILEILDRLHTKGLDSKSLEIGKNYIRGQFPLGYETPGNLADLLNDMFIYGFNESFIDNFNKTIEEITVEKTREIIARYFPKNNLQMVLVGNIANIRDSVKKYGEVSEKEITDEGY